MRIFDRLLRRRKPLTPETAQARVYYAALRQVEARRLDGRAFPEATRPWERPENARGVAS